MPFSWPLYSRNPPLMARMLFIVAGPQLLASLSEQFEALGGFTFHALDPQNVANMKDVGHDAAIVIDADFCDVDTVAHRLRTMGFIGMLIVIGAAPEEADASLARPFRFADLLTLLARPRNIPNADTETNIRLTEKEAAILARLMRAEGATLSRAELLADVWGYGPTVSTRTLETHIHRLRRKIESDPEHPRRLLTEDGGYRLTKYPG
jgi:hypothetical protein